MGLVQSEIPEFPGAGTTLKIFKANCMDVSVFLTSTVWVSSHRYGHSTPVAIIFSPVN